MLGGTRESLSNLLASSPPRVATQYCSSLCHATARHCTLRSEDTGHRATTTLKCASSPNNRVPNNKQARPPSRSGTQGSPSVTPPGRRQNSPRTALAPCPHPYPTTPQILPH